MLGLLNLGGDVFKHFMVTF